MMTSRIQILCLGNKRHLCLCCIWLSFSLRIIMGFPPEVYDSRYQIIRHGDINIGAILSIHDAVKRNEDPRENENVIYDAENEQRGCDEMTSPERRHIADEESTNTKSNRAGYNEINVSEILTSNSTNSDRTNNERAQHSQRISRGNDLDPGLQSSNRPTYKRKENNQDNEEREKNNPGKNRCTDSVRSFHSLEDVAAILFALDQINNSSSILPNVTLGVYILDDCYMPSLALARSIQFMPSASILQERRGLFHSKATRRKRAIPVGTALNTSRNPQSNSEKVFEEAELFSRLHASKRKPERISWTRKDKIKNLSLKSTENDTSTFLRNNSPESTHIENFTDLETSNHSYSFSESEDILREVLVDTRLSIDSVLGFLDKYENKKSRERRSVAPTINTVESNNLAITEDRNVTKICPVGTNQSLHDQDLHVVARQLPPFYDVVGVIGAYTSSLSIVVANVMTLYGMPQISHASTVDMLSDKTTFPYFFRTLPPDKYRIEAMANVIHHFGWTYISIVYSADQYGMHAEKSLRNIFQNGEMETCIAQSIELQDNMAASDYVRVIDQLRAHPQARVVALYADIKHIRPLMAAVRQRRAYREFIWAGSDTTSLETEMESENCQYILGSISITSVNSTPLGYIDYLRGFVKEYFSHMETDALHAGHGHNLDLDEKDFKYKVRRKEYRPAFAVPYAVDAVYAFAHALDNFRNANCKDAVGQELQSCLQGKSLLPYIRGVRFKGHSGDVRFNNEGDALGKLSITQCQIKQGIAQQVKIGTWDISEKIVLDRKQQWPNDSVPVSVCGHPCGSGQVYTFHKQTCCWTCVECKPNEITTSNATRCVECPQFHWPDKTFSTCLLIKPTYVKIRDLLPLSLAFLSVIGLMTSTITAFTFYTFRNERVIRSSSRELSFFMLIGVVSAFLLVFSLLVPPTSLTCYISHVGFGLTFTLVYAPLLVKTNRIYRIFKAGRKTTALPKWTSSTSQLLITTLFLAIQALIVTISTTVHPPRVTHYMPVRAQRHVTQYCDVPLAGLLSSLAFNLVLVIVCTWYAFKTRRLPDNYNESRYIAFCVDTTLLIWVTFVPTYFTVTRPYYKVIILALALLINSIVCLLCLFVPKLYALYLSRKESTSASRSAGREERSGVHVQMLSVTSFSGLIRSSPSRLQSNFSDKDMSSHQSDSYANHVTSVGDRCSSDVGIHENGSRDKQTVIFLTSPDDNAAGGGSSDVDNVSVLFSEHSDSTE